MAVKEFVQDKHAQPNKTGWADKTGT